MYIVHNTNTYIEMNTIKLTIFLQHRIFKFLVYFRLQTQWSLLSSDLGGPSHVSLFNSSKVSELREENKRLVTEREHLRKVLADREDDIKLIRKQWLKEKKNEEKNKTQNLSNEENNVLNSEIVLRLEGLQMKYGVVHQIVSPISNSESTNLFYQIFIMIFYSTVKLRKKNLFWTSNKFVFFFNIEKFVGKIRKTNW